MTQRFQKRKGIGNVITTLIILIASVVLGAGVIFFGGSMFQSNTQSESVEVSNVHSWVSSSGETATAFVVQNTGSKAVTINSIIIRGVSVPTSMWHYNITSNQALLQNELTVDYLETDGILGIATGDWVDNTAVSLAQGQAAIVYLMDNAQTNHPGNIATIDSGNTYTLQITAGQAQAVQQIQVVTSG